MKNTLVDQLVKHLSLQYPSWVAKGELTRREWRSKNGTVFLPETVGRELRRAEESRRIAVKSMGKSIAYKWLPHELRPRYIPTSLRKKGNEEVLFDTP